MAKYIEEKQTLGAKAVSKISEKSSKASAITSVAAYILVATLGVPPEIAISAIGALGVLLPDNWF